MISTEAATLWHPLDFSNDKVNEKQAKGLLDLARNDDSHKREFLEYLLEKESLAARFNHQPDLILGAAVGVGPERRNRFLKRLYVPPENETKPEIHVARALTLLDLVGTLTPENLIAAIQATTDDSQLGALGQGVAALPVKLTAAQAGALADKFVGAIQATTDPPQLRALGEGVAAVAGRISADDQAATLLFEVLKNPLTPRDTITAALRKRFPDAPPPEQGFWVLIAWADKRFPHLDLEAPLKEPFRNRGHVERPEPIAGRLRGCRQN